MRITKRRSQTEETLRSISRPRGSGHDAAPSTIMGPRLVVFVCGTDIGRAHMATTWFEMLADPAKARAVCASSSPVVRAEPQIAAVLREAKVPHTPTRPRALTRQLLAAASLIVTIGGSHDRVGLALPGAAKRREHWVVPNLDGPDRLDRARDMRDLLRSRVAMLAFMEGWGRADISREAARVTRLRRPIDVGGYRP